MVQTHEPFGNSSYFISVIFAPSGECFQRLVVRILFGLPLPGYLAGDRRGNTAIGGLTLIAFRRIAWRAGTKQEYE